MVGVSRQTVHRYLAMSAPPERRQPKRRGTVLDAWKPYLLRRWAEGCHNGMRLWREIREQGFGYSCTNVARFVAQVRRGEIACPAPCTDDAGDTGIEVHATSVGRTSLGTGMVGAAGREPDGLPSRDVEQHAYGLSGAPVRSRRSDRRSAMLARDFLSMVRERTGERLEEWIAAVQASERRGTASLRERIAG